MKTLKKALCIMLSVIMVLGCFSASAYAADEEKFTSTLKAQSTVSNKQAAKVSLDELDKILKDMDICEEVVLSDTLDLKITIDLRSVNALCGTIDEYVGILKFATVLGALVLGDLRDLDLSTWKKGLKRTGDDITILNAFVELANANRDLIEKICDGSINLGIFKSFVDVKDLLGEDGVSGLLRGLLAGIVYDEGTAAYNNAYNNIDSFIYNDLLTSFTEDIFPGFAVSQNSTVESLLGSIYNISLEKYIKPGLKDINIDLADSEIAELKALSGVVKLDFTDADLTGLELASSDIKGQLNNLAGKYARLFVPGCSWTEGGYENLKPNLEKAVKYVADKTGIIKNADEKSFEQIGMEIAMIILKNGDFGAYEEGLSDCETLKEMATRLLANTANEMEIGVKYTGKEDYLVIAGDIFASWLYDNFAVTDTDGRAYRPGGGKTVFEVANYFINYFFYERSGAAVMGISTSETEDVFTKLDKIIDYFGEGKKVNFSTKEFITGEKGLLDCVFSLDIAGLIDLTAVSVLEGAGNKSAVELLYKTVKNFLDNWAGKTLFPNYQKDKPFANALSNGSIANLISVLLETVNARKSAVITLATFCVAIIINSGVKTDLAIESAAVSDMTATGKALSPKAAVKAGGKSLTQNTDFIVTGEGTAPGVYTVKIKGIGLYNGEIIRSFRVNMDKVSTLSYTSTTDSVKLTWGKVPYADSYTVSIYDSAKKAYVVKKADIKNTYYTVTGLDAGKEYKFSVQAVHAVQGATAAKELTAYTVPSSVKASAVKASSTPTSIKLSWQAVTGATHYRLEQQNGSKWTELAVTDALNKTVSGLSGYTSYKFRITAIKKLSDGTSLASEPVTVSAKTALGTASSVKASSAATTVTLTWARVNNAQKYQVRLYTGSKWETLGTTEALTYKVTGLKAASQYKLSVRAMVKENDKWIYGDAKEITANTVPSSVKASAVKASSTPTSIKFSWQAVTGATEYKLEQYKADKWTTVATTEKTAKTVSGLSGYTSYKFRITAIKKLSDGTSLASEPVTVSAKTALGATSSLKAESAAASVTLTWAKVNNAQKYQVRRYTGGKWETVGTTSSLSYNVTGLKAATRYKLSVRAMVKENGKWVYGEATEITRYTSPAKPSSVKVASSSVTTTTAKITWKKVASATSYEVYAYIGGKWVKKATTSKTAVTVKELPAGTKTKLKVRAVAKLGGETMKSAFSSEVTAHTVVAKVKGLDTSLRKTNSISLKWKKTAGATAYEVYRYTGGKWKKLATTTKTSYTDSKSLKKGTEYKYKVRAVQKLNSKTTRYGEFSSVLKAKTTIIGSSRF